MELKMLNLLSKLKMKGPSKERLESIIALGKWRYVLTRGVLIWARRRADAKDASRRE